MKNVTLSAKWLGVVFAALFLAACSSNETKEAEAAAAAAEQAAQEAAAREAEQQTLAAAQETREAAAANVGTLFYFDFDSSSLTEEARGQVDAHVAALLGNNDSVRLEGHTDGVGRYCPRHQDHGRRPLHETYCCNSRPHADPPKRAGDGDPCACLGQRPLAERHQGASCQTEPCDAATTNSWHVSRWLWP